MSEWRTVRLGDVIDLFDNRRIPLSARQRSGKKGPYPYYGAQGVIDSIDEYIFDGRFILIPEDGENLRSRKLPIAYFADGKFWVNNHAHIVRAKSGIANDRFLQSAIQASDISPYITGAAQPKLSQTNLSRIELLLPDIGTQERVAQLLDALDDLAANNSRRIAILEDATRTVYLHHLEAPIDSGFGAAGWPLVPLGQFATLGSTMIQPSKSQTDVFEHFSIPAFDDAHLPSAEIGMTIRSGKFALSEPAILVSKLNPRIERVWFARPATGFAVTSTEFVAMRASKRCSLEFLYELARSVPFQSRMRDLSRGTSTSHQRVKPEDFARMEFHLPPASVIAAFTDEAKPILQLAHSLLLNNRALTGLRDMLLPKLVTGQIDVTNLDLDRELEEATA